MKKNLKKRLWGKMRPKKKVYKHRIQCTIHSLYGYRTDVAVILRKHMPALELGNCTTETAVVTGLPPGISAGVCASLSSVFSDQSPLLHHHFCSSSLWITHGPPPRVMPICLLAPLYITRLPYWQRDFGRNVLYILIWFHFYHLQKMKFCKWVKNQGSQK